MGFAPDTGVLVAAERGVRRVQVVAVGPHAARFDSAAHTVGTVDVAGPQPGARAELGVVGQRRGFGLILKVVTPITGPKISSRKKRMLLLPVINVGCR